MASRRQRALVIKTSSNDLTTLPDLHGHFPLFRPLKQTVSTEHDDCGDNHREVRWACHPDKLLSASGAQELSRNVLSHRPDHIYVILIPKPVKDLAPVEIRPLLDSEEAVCGCRSSSTLKGAGCDSRSNSLDEVPCKITLLFDGVLDSHSIREYEALFCAHETLSGSAAASIMLSRVENIISSNVQWSGSVQVCRDTEQPNNTIEFPGFHLSAKSPSAVSVPTRKAPFARVLAVANRMPSIACLFTATLGFQLRLTQSCSQRTAAFFNAVVSSKQSVLLGIGDAMFWCFWIPRRGDTFGQFAALYIRSMPTSAALALDVAALRSKLQLQDELLVRQLPVGISNLPVRPLLETSSVPRLSENIDGNSDLIIKDGISMLTEYAARGSTSIPLTCKRQPDGTVSIDDILHNEVSGAEVEILLRRQRDKEQTQTLGSGFLASTLTKSDSCSVMESRSLTGKKSSTTREVQLAFRQRRFQRLLQSQREKRVVESATTISSLGQRGKRVRSADIDPGRQRFVKTARQTSSSIYIGQAIRSSLNALRKCPSFYAASENDDQTPETSEDLAKSLSESCMEPSELPEDWEKVARSNHGRHGVEYLFDGDIRDKHIREYESLVAKTGMEFERRALQRHECAKLNVAINKIRSLKRNEPRSAQSKVSLEPDNYCKSLLQDLVDGVHNGKVVVTDSQLRERLLRFPVKSGR